MQKRHIQECKDVSLKNIQNLYYEFCSFNQDKLVQEFNEDSNPKENLVVTGMKIRGTYPDEETMRAALKELHSLEPYVDIYCADVGQWVPWCPGETEGLKVEYTHEKLNKIMQQCYKDSQDSKAIFEERFK